MSTTPSAPGARVRSRAPVAFIPPIPSLPVTQVATVLNPEERSRVDAAGAGLYVSLHRDSVADAIRDIREARASAVVLSVSYCERGATDPVASMVREFPRIPTLALLSEFGPRTPQTLLTLGTTGVRRLIDVREASGWRALRSALSDERGNSLQRLALQLLAEDLEGVSSDCWQFFELLFLCPVNVTTVRRLSQLLGVLSSTLMSRFFRAQLPPPKRYLAMARLVRAAHLCENQGFSIANVSNHMEFSSPQTFTRHVRAMLGISALEMRARYDGAGMLERFRTDLVVPYRDELRRLAPLRYLPSRAARARGRRLRPPLAQAM